MTPRVELVRELDLSPYEAMWTTELARYRAVPFRDGRFVIFDVEGGGPILMSVSGEIYQAIVRRMQAEGMETITPDEADRIGWERSRGR